MREPQGAQALGVSKSDIRRRGAVALVVGNDLHAVVHPHAHAPARHSRAITAQERRGRIWNIQALLLYSRSSKQPAQQSGRESQLLCQSANKIGTVSERPRMI